MNFSVLVILFPLQVKKWMEKAERIKAFLDIQNLNTEDTSVEEEVSENDFLSKWSNRPVESTKSLQFMRFFSFWFLWVAICNLLSWLSRFSVFKKKKN